MIFDARQQKKKKKKQRKNDALCSIMFLNLFLYLNPTPESEL